MTFNGALAVLVAVIAFILGFQAGWPPLSFLPGALAGTAVFFGTAFAFCRRCSPRRRSWSGWLSAIIVARIQAAIDPPTALAAQEPASPVQTA